MSDPRITPRAAAFQQQASLEHAQAEQVAQVNALAVHGDPSVAGSKTTQSAGTAQERKDRVAVEWVYVGDLEHRLMSAGLVRGAELNMRLHAWLRQQGKREITFPGSRRDPIPPAPDLGQDVTPERQAPGISVTR